MILISSMREQRAATAHNIPIFICVSYVNISNNNVTLSDCYKIQSVLKFSHASHRTSAAALEWSSGGNNSVSFFCFYFALVSSDAMWNGDTNANAQRLEC